MTVDAGVIWLVAVPTIGGIVWAIRQEGRINALTDRQDDMRTDIAEIKGDVRYISSRIDKAINGK